MKRVFLLASLVFCAHFLSAQSTIKGVVVDDKNQPVIGASVMVDGAPNAIVTDFDGSFEIPAEVGAKLSIAMLGYRSTEQVAAQDMVIVLRKKGVSSSSNNNGRMCNVSIEAGYDHGSARIRTHQGLDSYHEGIVNNFRMDGFHIGGNVQLDFLKGQHIPSLVIGLNYQFLRNDLTKTDELTKQYKKDFIDEEKQYGFSNPIYNVDITMHTIQLPIRVQYAYQINDFRIFAFTGPQFRFHVALQKCSEVSILDRNDNKWGEKVISDQISGRQKSIHWKDGNQTSEEYIPFYDNGSYTYITINADGKKETNKGLINFAQESGDDLMPWFDMSWGFGVGFAWKNISLNFSYDLGMMDIRPKNERKTSRNSSYERYPVNSDALAVTLGYRF